MRRTLKALIFAALTAAPAGLAAATECTVSGGVTTFPTGGHCLTEPSSYEIIVHEIGLCPAAPGLPTVGVPLDVSACAVVFSNASGATATISAGSSAAPSGTFSRPPDGAYTHGYAIIDNLFVVEASVDFGSAQTGDAGGTGRYCATAVGGSTGAASTAVCGATAPTVGALSAPLTDFGGGGGFAASASASFTGPSGGVVTMNGYALDATDALAAASGAVDRVFGLQAFSAPVTISTGTTSMNFAINVSQGMTVIDNAGQVAFDGGPFLIELSVR